MTKTFAFAAIAIVAALGAGTAAQAQVTVKVSDLNAANPAHAAELQTRIDTAARRYCRGQVRASAETTMGECRQAVRAEIHDKLAARRAVQVAARGVAG